MGEKRDDLRAETEEQIGADRRARIVTEKEDDERRGERTCADARIRDAQADDEADCDDLNHRDRTCDSMYSKSSDADSSMRLVAVSTTNSASSVTSYGEDTPAKCASSPRRARP